MRLRRSLESLRRRTWSIVACGVVVGGVVGAVMTLRPPTYSATARVQLRTDRASAQTNLVTSRAVALAAAAQVRGATSSKLADVVSARRIARTDQMAITATSASAPRSALIANAFARAYVENRRANAAAIYQHAVDDLDRQITARQAHLSDLDHQTGGKTPSPGTAAQLAAVANEVQALQTRRDDLQGNVDLQPGPAAVVAPATATDAAQNPSPSRVAVLGGLFFLLLAAAVVTLRELLDDRAHSSEAVERATGLPVLAELPCDQLSKKEPTRLAVCASPRSPLSEAARGLRGSIELRATGSCHSTVLITSGASGEGKSLVSANLAAAYALAGHRTVLVDADLRTPRLSHVFGNYPARLIASHQAVNGLSGLLSELTESRSARATLEQAALLRTELENLLFLPAGLEHANPSELLDSPAMAVLLEDLAGIADIIIIDSPPLLPVGDAVGLARQANAVVLVAAVGESQRSALRRSRQILAAHPHVLGVVVNKVATKATYAPYRRPKAALASETTSPSLRVVHRLEIPTPPTGRPDANGDIWIDLSDESDGLVTAGALPVGRWGR